MYGGTLLTAQVGDQTQSSSVIISGWDTITAGPGEDGQPWDGGNVYSGGGVGPSGYAGNGGSDGRDGGGGTGETSPSTPSPPGPQGSSYQGLRYGGGGNGASGYPDGLQGV